MGSQLRKAISPRAIHLCVDMQNIFMPGAPWATPWMSRVAPIVEEIANRFVANTVFTRFITPARPDDMPGTWQSYYRRWHKVTRSEIDPELLELIPQLKRFVPPASVIDKAHYSPFTEPNLVALLNSRQVDTLVITGAETDVCVLATVLGAVDLGYRTIIVSDAICSSADAHHDALLQLYHQRFTDQVETADAEHVLSQWTRM
jgi:nicotinamidase-related amidase